MRRAYRKPSPAAELGKYRLNLRLSCKASLIGVAQATIDTGQFRIARLIIAAVKTLLDITRNLGQFVLSVGRPAFDTFKDFSKLLGFHKCSVTRIRTGGIRCAIAPSLAISPPPYVLSWYP